MDIRRLKQKGKYFYPLSMTSAIYDLNIKDTNEQLLSQAEINKTIYSNIEDIQSDTTNIKKDLNTTKDRVTTIETNNINDIQIDGESIVDTQIANIDYLKKGDQILIKADTDTVHAIVTNGKVDLGDSNTVTASKQAAIGFDNTIASNVIRSYILGHENTSNSADSVVIGGSNTNSNTTAANANNIILGYSNTNAGKYNYIIGTNNTLPSESYTSRYVIGDKNTVNGSKLNVVGIDNVAGGGSSNIIGFSNKVNTDSTSLCYCNAIGYNITINNNAQGTALGRNITLDNVATAVGTGLSCDNVSNTSLLFGSNLHIYHAKQSMLLGVKNFINDEAKTSITSSELFAFGWQNQFFDDYDTTALHNCRSTSIGITNHTYTGELSFIYGYDNELYRTSMCNAIGTANTVGSNTADTTLASAFGVGNVVTGNRASAFGFWLKAVNEYETALGHYNDSISDDTIFSVGNGYYNATSKTTIRHNLLESNQDGDLYIVEKTNTDGDTTNFYERPMKRLQTWLNEKADLNSLDNYSKKITTTSSSDLAITLKPNTNVDITCNADLTITLEAPTDESIVNVYTCTVTTGEDSGTVTVLANVIWNEEITIEANSFYEINIRYSGGSYFGIIHKWDNGLPSGYKKLEYIENTSQAYIDTGVDGGHFNKVYHKFILTEITGTWINIWGTRNWSTAQGRALYINVAKKCFGVNHNSVNIISTIPCNTDTLYQVTYNNGTFRINNQTLVYDAATFSNTKNCRLFQLNDASTPLDDETARQFARMKCYSFKMWQDGTIVRDFVPARQLSDDKVGMYDKVEGKFYSSAHDGYEFKGSDEYIKLVDLGLTSGTLWADRNVGANKVIDYGLHYAWGETDGYSDVTTDKQFSWTDYKYANGDYNKLTKYCNNSSYGNDSYTDKLTTLEITDDASYSVDTFVMPTKAQLQELIDETTYTWTTKDGVAGGLFASKVNSNSIFIPASGCFYSTLKNVGEQGNIWSSSLYEASPNYAWLMRFNSSGVSINHFDVSRCDGCSIRGVKV